MKVTLPLFYEAEARRRSSADWRSLRIVEHVIFDVPELSEAEAPVAIGGLSVDEPYARFGFTQCRWIEGRLFTPDRLPGHAVPEAAFATPGGLDLFQSVAFRTHLTEHGAGLWASYAGRNEGNGKDLPKPRDALHDVREGASAEQARTALAGFASALCLVGGVLHHASGVPGYVPDFLSPRIGFAGRIDHSVRGAAHRFRLDRREEAVAFAAALAGAAGRNPDPAEIEARMPPPPEILVDEAVEFDDEAESVMAAARHALDVFSHWHESFDSTLGLAYYGLMARLENLPPQAEADCLDGVAAALSELSGAAAQRLASPGPAFHAAEAAMAAERWERRPIPMAGLGM